MSIDKSVNIYELHLSAYSDFSLFSSVGLVKFFVFFFFCFLFFFPHKFMLPIGEIKMNDRLEAKVKR